MQAGAADSAAGVEAVSYTHLLNKAQERAHILEGLLKALDNIDEVIRIIRAARNVQIAKQELMDRFELTDVQARCV